MGKSSIKTWFPCGAWQEEQGRRRGSAGAASHETCFFRHRSTGSGGLGDIPEDFTVSPLSLRGLLWWSLGRRASAVKETLDEVDWPLAELKRRVRSVHLPPLLRSNIVYYNNVFSSPIPPYTQD